MKLPWQARVVLGAAALCFFGAYVGGTHDLSTWNAIRCALEAGAAFILLHTAIWGRSPL